MSVGLQDASTQVAALVEMAVRLGPHWQPWSVRAQPAATMADVRQGICARLESWGCRLLGGGAASYGARGLAGEVLGDGDAGSSGEDEDSLHCGRCG